MKTFLGFSRIGSKPPNATTLSCVKASRRKGLVVRNRGELASSAKISGLRSDSVVAVLDVPLMQPGSKVSFKLPNVEVDRWVLDHERVTLDYDRRNNSRQTRLLGGVEPFNCGCCHGWKTLNKPSVLDAGIGVERPQRSDGRYGDPQHDAAPTRFHLPMDAVVFSKLRGR